VNDYGSLFHPQIDVACECTPLQDYCRHYLTGGLKLFAEPQGNNLSPRAAHCQQLSGSRSPKVGDQTKIVPRTTAVSAITGSANRERRQQLSPTINMPPRFCRCSFRVTRPNDPEEFAMRGDSLLPGPLGDFFVATLHLGQPETDLVTEHIPAQQQSPVARCVNNEVVKFCVEARDVGEELG
jgi:hypothetical protein